MSARYISTLLFFIAVICVVYSLTKAYNQCPPPEIKYKYIEKTFAQQQDNPNELNKIFGPLFNNPSPWVGYPIGIDESDYENISQ
jgi:hypothetical protein